MKIKMQSPKRMLYNFSIIPICIRNLNQKQPETTAEDVIMKRIHFVGTFSVSGQ